MTLSGYVSWLKRGKDKPSSLEDSKSWPCSTSCISGHSSNDMKSGYSPCYLWSGLLALLVIIVFLLVKRFQEASFTGPLGGVSVPEHSRCVQFRHECDEVAPFIFDSLNSLLKQWPSSYAPVGHSLVPAILPGNTLLYHANGQKQAVKKPTWFAFDAWVPFHYQISLHCDLLYTSLTRYLAQ